MTTKKIRERRLRPENSYRKIRFESLEARKLMAADVAESVIAVEDSYDAEITAFVDDQALQAKEILIKCEDFPLFLPRGGDESEEPSGPCTYVLDDLINGIKIDTSRGDDNDELFDLDDLGDSATEETSPSDDSDKLDDERVDVPKCGLDSVYRNAWWNESIPSDVDNDGSISVLDALNVINAINSVGVVPVSELSVRAASMNSSSGASSVGQVDINTDGYLTPIDALIVVNQVKQRWNCYPMAAINPSSSIVLRERSSWILMIHSDLSRATLWVSRAPSTVKMVNLDLRLTGSMLFGLASPRILN
jgi:hypothetical protein